MKKTIILTLIIFLSSCVSQQALEERAALRDKIDHEECIKLSFIVTLTV